MTNINCTKNCVYQLDGKCCYDNVTLNTDVSAGSLASECAYQLTSERANKLGIKMNIPN